MEYKNIFITGASRGIGRALSEYYATTGVNLGILCLKHEKELEDVAVRCRDKGAKVYMYIADVSDQSAMKKCALDYLSRVDSIDLVVANAGIALVEDPDLFDSAIPAQDMAVNYLGMINTFFQFIPLMKKLRRGHLAVISSVASFRSTTNSGAYSASKAAINLWTEGLRLRLASYGICVTTVCVGFVDTAMTKGNSFWMPGIISAQVAAKLIASAIKRRKRLITLPWQQRFIWNFLRIMPDKVYDMLVRFLLSKHQTRIRIGE